MQISILMLTTVVMNIIFADNATWSCKSLVQILVIEALNKIYTRCPKIQCSYTYLTYIA